MHLCFLNKMPARLCWVWLDETYTSVRRINGKGHTHTIPWGGLCIHLKSPGWQPTPCVAWCQIKRFVIIEKSMVIHDTECPYWDLTLCYRTSTAAMMTTSILLSYAPAKNNACQDQRMAQYRYGVSICRTLQSVLQLHCYKKPLSTR